MTARPRFATRPTPGARHEADEIARLARVLGRPLMPWQYDAARVATEFDPIDPRRYRYRIVRISVPRQSGKTTFDHIKNMHRTIKHRRRSAFYTAQTGKDAKERWLDAVQLVDDSPLTRFTTPEHGGNVYRAAGSQAIIWPNGSSIRPFAPTSASLHGYTPDTVDEDEVWHFDDIQGADLNGAIGPAQITLPHAQRWQFSTMGDATSTYWHGLVEQGRAAVDDPESRICYIEYSAPDGADLYDPEVWALFHPALGHTIGAVDLADAAENESAGTWQRAYCNLKTLTSETVLDMEAFAACGMPELVVEGAGGRLAYDVGRDAACSSISLANVVDDDQVAVRVVRSAPGVHWLADAVIELADRWNLWPVYADDAGPTRDVTDQLRLRGREVTTLNSAEYATACGSWLSRSRDRRLTHDASTVLDAAMRAAALRHLGDAIAFSRSKSAGPIDALVASAVAVRAALLAPPPLKPQITA